MARCETRQRIRNASRRFRVNLGQEHAGFDVEAYIGIMYLAGSLVLHIIGAANRFSEARSLTKVTTDAVWEAFIMCWYSNMYWITALHKSRGRDPVSENMSIIVSSP